MLKLSRRPAEPMFDRRGYYRSPVTLPSYRRGQPAPNKGRTFPAEILTRDEANRILAQLGKGLAGARDRGLFVVQYRCGLRIAEALELRPKDVDLDEGTVTVLHGKGDHRRVVGIDPQAAAVVQRWVDRRRQLAVKPSQPLFCVFSQGSAGETIHASVFRDKLKRAAVRAGVEKRVHPHGLRHTFAVDFVREGGSLVMLKILLGHADLNTTWRYVNHIFPMEAIDALRNRTWELPTLHDSPPDPVLEAA